MSSPRSPLVTRFLSDFTLGFSDGLTVPFALSAGLSSLGRTQTVIYAGLAELCAGSISMGIGGYLSALDDVRAARQKKQTAAGGDVEERRGMLSDEMDGSDGEEKDEDQDGSSEGVVRGHLAPLNLPPHLLSQVLSAVGHSEDGLQRAARHIRSSQKSSDQDGASDPFVVSPWFSGLSISIGYIIGGLIPLLPYCIASTIGAALTWSIGLCLLALFSFGFGKACLLSDHGARVSYPQAAWEGLRMLLLGSLAAAVAVLCINLIEGDGEP